MAVKCSSAHVTPSCAAGGRVRRRKPEQATQLLLVAVGHPEVAPQHVVERPVPAAVHGLLTDERVDRREQLRIAQPGTVATHGVHEEPLALGEEHRQRAHERGHVCVASVPVPWGTDSGSN